MSDRKEVGVVQSTLIITTVRLSHDQLARQHTVRQYCVAAIMEAVHADVNARGAEEHTRKAIAKTWIKTISLFEMFRSCPLRSTAPEASYANQLDQ